MMSLSRAGLTGLPHALDIASVSRVKIPPIMFEAAGCWGIHVSSV